MTLIGEKDRDVTSYMIVVLPNSENLIVKEELVTSIIPLLPLTMGIDSPTNAKFPKLFLICTVLILKTNRTTINILEVPTP